MAHTKRQKFLQRKYRVARRVRGTSDYPRLSVFRSNKQIYAQIIDDEKAITLVSASSKEEKTKEKKAKLALSQMVGEEIAKKALAKKIKKVRFDRSGYKYHGRVAVLAEAARKAGLTI